MKNRRMAYTLGVALLLAFAGFSFTAFKETLTPYVSFTQAREMDRTVQVAGGLLRDSSSYDEASESLLFTLTEMEGGNGTLRVRYNGLKPANFEDAISIVAIGQYDPTNQELRAEKLLVKCPSKYQGSEVKTYG
jgi:cytochrome c-type biogenesis protein CcmE